MNFTREPIKVILGILAVGFVIGGWRAWHPGASDHALAEYSAVDIPMITTQEKDSWVKAEVYPFNAVSGGKWHVTFTHLDSRAAMQAILSGKQKPVLWDPDNPIWVARLSEVWQQEHGQSLVDLSDTSSFHVFMRSPIVFLTTKEKAAFLRPVIGGTRSWAGVRDLSMGKITPPWGRFRFSHGDPLTSNSGMLTLGMILNRYVQDRDPSADLSKAASDPRFIQYLEETERGFVGDTDGTKSSYDQLSRYLKDTSSRDFIVVYENVALAAASKDPDLAVIYPNPTAVAEESLSLINGPWVTEQQRAGATAFLQYASRADSLKAGLKYNMRPAVTESGLALTTKLRKYNVQGFQTTFASEETPSYEALNTAAFQWKKHISQNLMP